MRNPEVRLIFDRNKLVVDNFAGGGGASEGIAQAIGRDVDIAINHDAEAIAMHKRNHPNTRHYVEDVFDIDIKKVCGGKPVGFAWFSPDCTFHSKARGGKPFRDRQRARRRRGLAWIVIKWAKLVRPEVIGLENVEEFAKWGPLNDDGTPDKTREGYTFRRWCSQLRNLGYEVDMWELPACDYGAPTTRNRLFMVARCDGARIHKPEPTHAQGGYGGLQPFRTAAECIDWSIPCPSIFERDRPLADNTLRRIAEGIRRFVVECPQPFLVGVGGRMGQSAPRAVARPMHTTTCKADTAIIVPTLVRTAHGERDKNGKKRGKGAHAINAPLGTVTASNDFALMGATLIQTGYGEREGQAPRVPGLGKPLGTVVAGGAKHALVTAFLAKHYGGVVGHGVDRPIGTVTRVDHHSVVTSNLIKMRGTSTAQAMDEPLHTVSAGGNHFAEVRAFLVKFYSTGGQWGAVNAPLGTITTKDRLGLVTIAGQDYMIADIGLRMLSPRELFNAQGFDPSYIIDMDYEGKPMSARAQVEKCGNSVCPPVVKALVEAQFGLAA